MSVSKQDEWFNKALDNYKKAREVELNQNNLGNQYWPHYIASLESSLIKYNYICKTRPINEPDHEECSDDYDKFGLVDNLNMDLYTKTFTASEAYTKYIAQFLLDD